MAKRYFDEIKKQGSSSENGRSIDGRLTSVATSSVCRPCSPRRQWLRENPRSTKVAPANCSLLHHFFSYSSLYPCIFAVLPFLCHPSLSPASASLSSAKFDPQLRFSTSQACVDKRVAGVSISRARAASEPPASLKLRPQRRHGLLYPRDVSIRVLFSCMKTNVERFERRKNTRKVAALPMDYCANTQFKCARRPQIVGISLFGRCSTITRAPPERH